MFEARCALRFRLEKGQCLLRRKSAPFEVGADVRVAVAPLGELSGARLRRALVVEVAEALEMVQSLPALVAGEAALLQPRIELRPGAVGCAQGPERDVLGSRLRL